ncbi:MAG: hypothetical protein WCE69_14370 [Aestuariivirga sp.]
MNQAVAISYSSNYLSNREQTASFFGTNLRPSSLVVEKTPQVPTGGSDPYYISLYSQRPAGIMDYATDLDSGLTKALRAAGIIVICYLGNNNDVRAQAVPTTPTAQLVFSGGFTAAEKKPRGIQQNSLLAAELIGQIQSKTGLTLELIAPLLGVSRRALQSWKAGETISLRNEERLRELADAIMRLPRGNSQETKNLLLERIPGVVRIYDLLAERRFADAIARANSAEKPEPIYSDQSIVFQHLPIDAQLAVIEDEPSAPAGQLDRKVSRRLKL